jgi:hypothetical protein
MKNRNTLKRAFFILLLSAGLGSTAHAAFQLPVLSPRLSAMGGVPLAGSDDAADMFTNPAALSALRTGEVYFMYDSMFAGLAGAAAMHQGFLSAAVPTSAGVFAAGANDFMASGLQEERTVALAFARSLGAGFSVGFAAKQLYQDYKVAGDPLAASDPVFMHGTSRSAAAFDAGLLATPADDWKAGLSVHNVNQPDVGIASVDRVNASYDFGLAHLFRYSGIRAAFGLSYGDPGYGTLSDHLIPALGLEKMYLGDRLALRAGINTNELTGGFGVLWGRIGLDYAFSLNRNILADNAGTHKVGLRYMFGDEPSVQASK